MSQEHKPVVAEDPVGALAQFVRNLRLVWRLLNDARVPIFPKLIIPAAILYILSPIDLLPDLILGLGQLDDIAIVLLGISFFIEMCPPAIVQEHRRALGDPRATADDADQDVIEGSYNVMSDDQPRDRL